MARNFDNYPELYKTLIGFSKNVLPDPILRMLTGIFYGWHGNYNSWEEASKKSMGYEDMLILEKAINATGKVIENNSLYERDTCVFTGKQYSYPLLSGLMWIAAKNNGKLNVLDFGGSLGSSYHQNFRFLKNLNSVKWGVVEQKHFVEEGIKNFSDNNLKFFYSIQECLASFKPDVVLLSSVLQYLPDPVKLLKEIMETGITHIIIDRTPFIKGTDRITIQKVHPAIYKANYPCWFFNKKKFLDHFTGIYEIIMEFQALDRANIKSEFLGFIFELKK